MSRSQENWSEFFSFTIGVVGGTFLEVIAQIYSKGDNCSICGPVSFFVRGGIWHWAERYNCNFIYVNSGKIYIFNSPLKQHNRTR